MAPDADAGKSDPTRRSVCAADVGDARCRRRPRDLCRKRRPRRRHSRGLSAWRARQRLPARSPPAVRSRTLPRHAVRPARRRPQPPQGPARGQHAAAPDRGHGDDPRKIRLRALDGGRRLLGRDAGAGLCAGPSRARQRHRAARDVSRHPRGNRKRFSRRRCRGFYPGAAPRISSACCRRTSALSRSMPTSAASSIPIPPCTARRRGPGARPSASSPSMRRTARGSISPNRHSSRALPATPFMEAHYFANNCFMQPNQLIERGRQTRTAFPASSCRAAMICCARPRHRTRLPRCGCEAEIRIVEGAGHTLYDPGVRDAVMKAIADMASRITR